jgi:hypothetical protein
MPPLQLVRLPAPHSAMSGWAHNLLVFRKPDRWAKAQFANSLPQCLCLLYTLIAVAVELGTDLQLFPGFSSCTSCPGAFLQPNVHPIPGSVRSWNVDLPPVWSAVTWLVNGCVDWNSLFIPAATWNPHFLYLVSRNEVPFQQGNILPLSPRLFIF